MPLPGPGTAVVSKHDPLNSAFETCTYNGMGLSSHKGTRVKPLTLTSNNPAECHGMLGSFGFQQTLKTMNTNEQFFSARGSLRPSYGPSGLLYGGTRSIVDAVFGECLDELGTEMAVVSHIRPQ